LPEALFCLAAAFSVLAVLLICFFMFKNGLPAIRQIGLRNFLLGRVWRPANGLYGIFPMLVGSLYVTGLALFLGGPLGILIAVFLSRFCPRKFYGPLKSLFELLSGIPSVVYGFFGLMVLVPFVRNNFGGRGLSLLSAGLLLAFMILPTLIGMAEAALRSVPNSYYEGSLALGASHERSVFFVLLPAARSGILAGLVLGLGRAVGETMAVIMVAGNQPVIPEGLLSGLRTLTANIVMEMGYAADLHREALFATALVLFVCILLVNLLFSFLKRRAKL